MGTGASKRVVAIRAGRQGTGVLLTPTLILTCAHVVRDGDPPDIWVAHPGRRTRIRCSVVWSGLSARERLVPRLTRMDLIDRLDAALLRAETEVITPAELGTLRWGRPTADEPLAGCHTIGFPDHQRYGPGDRRERLDLGQYRGSVLPLAGRVRGALTFWLDHSPGAAPPGGTSPLAGLSGSPVFASGTLLGIVSQVRETDGGRHLEAVPVADLEPVLTRYAQLPELERVSGLHSADTPFEEGYARSLKAQYSRMEIFGIDELGVSETSWDLDTAYLSLEAAPLESADRAPIDGFPSGPTPPHDDGFPPGPTGPRRVEELLGRSRRTLLRGEAGAGKTTLVWWLAAHAACGTLPAELAELQRLVPFVVPMRSVQARGRGFPGPDELARVADLPIGDAPRGWAERVLESGRALVLVDGLDELPRAERQRARGWLTGLLRRYPAARCLATVRPGAVEADWLTAEGFADVQLLPMSDQDINAFVTSWHTAARLECAALDRGRADSEADRLGGLEQRLRKEFADNRVLRDLARAPLLCAVICALHRKRGGRLPHTRWELYRATLDMLLGKRDSVRRIDAPEGLTIGIEEHKLLLQHIAVWLVRGGRNQLTPAQAVTQLDKAIRGMPQVREQGGTEQILTHLLNRSGLLQQRRGNAIQFIHRTFQDYLAAKELAETDSADELVRHAHEEQWQDVILLSVGHFDRRVGGLIEKLLDLAGDVLSPALLLAGRCAASAVFLDDTVRTRVERRLREIMPPRDSGQAKKLAALGPSVLPLLPGPSGSLGADQAVIETIALVGDETGIERLVEFTRHPDPAIHRKLADVWTSFPAERYARDVLSRASPRSLAVFSPAQLAMVGHCARVSSLYVHGDHGTRELDRHLPADGLNTLALYGNPGVTDLGFVASRPSIERLTLLDCPGLRSLGELSDRSLRLLIVSPAELALTGPHPRVKSLSVMGAALIEGARLAHWNTVELLTVLDPVQEPSLLAAIGRMPALTSLLTTAANLGDLADARPVPRLTGLWLQELTEPLDTARLARVFPSLRRLGLRLGASAAYPLDLTPLRTLPGLEISINDTDSTRLLLTGAEHFGDRLSTD
ncbi:NACHT domain-containing protein [Streptomyces sp. CAU 1734]|uniref:NACHT domain-containing protein n=1 Tax=Streptomyces sp. CAU 1734 TaxID=3140360 RepID=UPI003260E5AA